MYTENKVKGHKTTIIYMCLLQVIFIVMLMLKCKFVAGDGQHTVV